MTERVRTGLVTVVLLMAVVLIVGCGGNSAGPTPQPTDVSPAASVPAPSEPTQANPTAPSPTTAPASPTTESASPTAETAPTTSAPPEATTQSAQADNWVDPTPGEFTKEDVDHIFPPGRGQDLVFQNCTNCHNWVPLVFAQFDRTGWEQNMKNHRERVSGLSEEDHRFIIEYLIQNFPPDKPPPDNIPQELLDQWTSY